MTAGVGQPGMPVVVLISGTGSNLQALIDRAAASPHYRIAAVISNRPEAVGLARAARADIPTAVLDHRQYPDRASYDRDLGELIGGFQPGIVALAGFMRILSPALVERFSGRMLNIHPSLLPKYQGLDTHARAIAAGETEHGCSVHFVTAELDGGPVILQARVPLLTDDTPAALAARVLQREHQIYPLAVELLARGLISMRDGRVWLLEQPLDIPMDLDRMPAGLTSISGASLQQETT